MTTSYSHIWANPPSNGVPELQLVSARTVITVIHVVFIHILTLSKLHNDEIRIYLFQFKAPPDLSDSSLSSWNSTSKASFKFLGISLKFKFIQTDIMAITKSAYFISVVSPWNTHPVYLTKVESNNLS